METPVISPRLSNALAGLRAAGVTPTDADVVWLGKLAERVQCPSAGNVRWVAGAPINHCGITFWPWTLLGEEWFHRWYSEFTDTEMKLAAYAFPHVKSEPGCRELLAITDYSTVTSALKGWMKSLPMPMSQLVEVCERLRELDGEDDDAIQDPDKKPPEADDGTDQYSAVRTMAYLCKAFPGSTPDYWRTGIAKAIADEMMDAVSMAAEREPGQAPDPDSPRMRAIHNFRMAVKWILRNHEARNG